MDKKSVVQVTCAFCGLPFRIRVVKENADYYCCSGCALASRIPVHADRLPVSRGLIIALAVGFGLFNQTLFGTLGAAIVAEGRLSEGHTFTLIGSALGAVLAVVCIGLLATAPQRKITDAIVGVLLGLIAGWSCWQLVAGRLFPGVWWLLGANGGFAVWLARGWLRRAGARLRGVRAK